MNTKEYKGIKIPYCDSKYAIWHIDEELDTYYKISQLKDRGRITTINKSKCYTKAKDPNYLYSDVIITNFTLPFAFANFKTIVVD